MAPESKDKPSTSDIELPATIGRLGHANGSSSSSANSDPGDVEGDLPPPPPVLDHFSTLSLIGTALSVLNTWNAATQSIYVSLPAGGNTSMLWGMIAGGMGSLLIASSLAEICHVLPLTGGQYHWTYILAKPSARNSLSYLTGWLACSGWIVLTASAPYFAASLTLSIISGFHPDYVSTSWQFFLVYMGYTLYGAIVCCFGARIFDWMNRISMWSSDASAITIFLTLLACAASEHRLNSAAFTFGNHINITGWPDGVAWILGLLQAQYALVGVDGAAHLVDEIHDAHVNSPKAMVFASLIGSLHGFVVLVAVAATMTDPLAIIDAGASAMMEAFTQGTGSLAGGTALTTLGLFTFTFNTPALLTSASRMVQSFAADGNLPARTYISKTDAKHETPIWAVLFCTGWLTILGLLEFGSDLTLAAILNTSVVLIQFSYLPTIALLMMNRKTFHLHARKPLKYSMGNRWGPIVNALAFVYIVLTSLFFFFPTSVPLTSSEDMNWTVAVFSAVVFLAGLNWIFFARHGARVPDEIRNKLGLDFDEHFAAQLETRAN
ncbi:amino acid transporter [Microstroma glucosiphilum]|uniref:Amino acid transporter n=1 Tax=Pseudomicrostroma glucosiphilum TaxID=1684307 RepID=A0A316UA82_9BASI|nr:amino acid transporter [Pseudomicrostroma glucosiphilum]PWN22069.1 amino acid transporter [Pseudomicrostroma glucosiphilum]